MDISARRANDQRPFALRALARTPPGSSPAGFVFSVLHLLDDDRDRLRSVRHSDSAD
jgi:hypothetical protein